MSYVLTHKEDGVYLGSFMGMGFWSLLDSAGQAAAVVFESEEKGRQAIASWDCQRPIDEYTFHKIQDGLDYADVEHLRVAKIPECMIAPLQESL